MFFSTVEEWNDHMRSHRDDDWFQNIHRTRWACPSCNDNNACFLTESDLENHLELDEHRNPAVWGKSTLKRNRVLNPRKKYCCPLCNVEQKHGTPRERSDQLDTHFLAHLEDLSLVSIHDWDAEISNLINASINGADAVDVGRRNPLHRRSGPNHDQGKSMQQKLLCYPMRLMEQG